VALAGGLGLNVALQVRVYVTLGASTGRFDLDYVALAFLGVRLLRE